MGFGLVFHSHNMSQRPQHSVVIKLNYQGDMRRLAVNSQECNTSQLISLVRNTYDVDFPSVHCNDCIISTPSDWSSVLMNACENKEIVRLQISNDGTEDSVAALLQQISEEIPQENQNAPVPDMEEENLSENQLEALKVYGECLIEFESYIKRDYITWDTVEERETWKSTVNELEGLSSFKVCTGTLVSHVPVFYNEDVTQQIDNIDNIKDLVEFLRNYECSMGWSYVLPSFTIARESWVAKIERTFDILENFDENNPSDHLSAVIDGLLHLSGVMRPESMTWSEGEHTQFENEVEQVESAVKLGELMHKFSLNVTPDKMYHGWEHNHHPEHSPTMLQNPTISQLARCLIHIEAAIGWSAVLPEFRDERADFVRRLQRVQDASNEAQEVPETIHQRISLPNNVEAGDTISFSLNIPNVDDDKTPVDIELSLGTESSDLFTVAIKRDANQTGCIKSIWGSECMSNSLEEWADAFPLHAEDMKCEVKLQSDDCVTLCFNGVPCGDAYLPSQSALSFSDFKVAKVQGPSGTYKLTKLEYSFARTVNLFSQ